MLLLLCQYDHEATAPRDTGTVTIVTMLMMTTILILVGIVVCQSYSCCCSRLLWLSLEILVTSTNSGFGGYIIL